MAGSSLGTKINKNKNNILEDYHITQRRLVTNQAKLVL